MPLASTFSLQWYGPAAAAAVITASGSITAAEARGTIRAVASLSGAGGVSYARPIRLLSASATVDGSGSVSSAQPRGRIKASATIKVNELSQDDVSGAVLDTPIEGDLTLRQISRLLTAFIAGQTNIVDLGGGAATVTFRDQANTKDRITGTMSGSERTTVAIDPD